MKAKLKELIDKAEPFAEGDYDMFLLIPSGRMYDGFWGKNGYDSIIILGKLREVENWTRIDNEASDVFTMQLREYNGHVNFDIPHDLGCFRICLSNKLHIGPCASTVMAEYGW